MKDQAITYSTLEKNIYRGDFYKYSYLQDKNVKDEAICEALRLSQNFSKHVFNITTIESDELDKDGDLKKRNFLAIFPEKLLIRKCARNIAKISAPLSQDRNKTIRELCSCLKWGAEQKIYKIDIASYYESLSPSLIKSTIMEDEGISNHTKNITISLLNQYWSSDGKGLPRGLEISNPIANLILRNLDREIKNHPDCLFYSRFIDDILIVSNQSNGVDIKKTFKKMLPEQLWLNTSKTASLNNDKTDSTFSYLGYEISVQGIDRAHGYRNITLTHTKSKIKSVKDRIFQSFLDYSRTKDFDLLVDRLKYLSCNRSFKRGRGRYKSGIYYSNSEVNNSEKLGDIDKYVYAFSKNQGLSFLKGRCQLTVEQQRKLKKINFKAGFEKRFHLNLSYRRTQEVIKIWRQ